MPERRQLTAGTPTWAERVRAAYEAWHHWHLIPGRFRMDRAVKATGLRAVIVERDHLREVIEQINDVFDDEHLSHNAAVLRMGKIARDARDAWRTQEGIDQ